jgi:hypothetical protein
MEREGIHAARAQRETVSVISSHLARFEDSFRWAKRNTDTDEDRGALISAIGWCSGWTEINRLFGNLANAKEQENGPRT